MKILRIIGWTTLCAALILIAAAFTVYPGRYIDCCFKGFALWAECVAPSLFPFTVITLILIKTGVAEKAALPLKKVTGFFNLPPSAAICFVMSVLSGYPAGSRAVAEFYDGGLIDGRDCKKLSALCSTSGPLFIIGTVGAKMLGDNSAGWKILSAHLLSVTVTALILCLFAKKGEKRGYRKPVKDENVLYNAFYGSVISVCVAGGFIAFFCVAGQIAQDFNLLLPVEKLLCLFLDGEASKAVCIGLIEATSGCRALSLTRAELTMPLAGFLITFGGLSILLQQLCYFVKAKVNPFKFTAVKFVQGILCFFLLLLFQ